MGKCMPPLAWKYYPHGSSGNDPLYGGLGGEFTCVQVPAFFLAFNVLIEVECYHTIPSEWPSGPPVSCLFQKISLAFSK
jgi:hypothetical protein